MNNPFDFFERIYCINLSHRTDKWEESLKEFEKVGIQNKVVRFEGIKFDRNLYGYMYARGGCFASHREIINICKQENVSNVLVLEDDIYFRNDPVKNLDLSLKELKEHDWDIYYLGMNVTTEVYSEPLIRISENLLKVKSALTTHAIAYNNLCYDDILNNIPAGDNIINWLYQNESMDGWFMRYFLNTKNVFCPNEFLATQRENISDIDLMPITYSKSIEDNFYKLRPL
jgi:GR25 family glycosyltransferase involved in LPS biosynthesis